MLFIDTLGNENLWDRAVRADWISNFVELQISGQGLGVDFTFTWDNNNNKNDKNSHLNFLKETVLGDKEQGVGFKDKG